MENKMENKGEKRRFKDIALFVGKTVFYLAIMITLIYMYHFIDVETTSFIYNQF